MLQALSPGQGQSVCGDGALIRASWNSERAGGSARSLTRTKNLDKSNYNHPVGGDTPARDGGTKHNQALSKKEE